MIPIKNKKKSLEVTVEEMRNLSFAYIEKYSPSKQQLKTYLLKKYLKFNKSNWLKKYTIIKKRKNLKYVTDLINKTKFEYSYPTRYKDLIKLIPVDKNTSKNNKKIILRGKLNLFFKICDFNWIIPKQQNITIFKLIIRLPKIKLAGKKLKTRFVNTGKSILFFLKIISVQMIP